MDKDKWVKRFAAEIRNVETLKKILIIKNPSYPFLYFCIDNAIFAMVNSVLLLKGENKLFEGFDEGYFMERQKAMHRQFISDLHIAIEEGLKRLLEEIKVEPTINRKIAVERIVDTIKTKLDNKIGSIKKELEDILKLGGKFPAFKDYLDTSLKNVPELNRQYKKDARKFFEAYSIVRNKVSHSDTKLSEIEKEKLKTAKLGMVIGSDDKVQMTFEGYNLLLGDVIRFFDNLYANLPTPTQRF